MNFLNSDLTTLHQQLVNKEISAEELTKRTLENIKSSDSEISAFLSLNDKALDQAKEIDKKGIDPDNLLSGIPVGLKDNFMTRDMDTTAASKMLEGFRSVYDATVVDKLNNKDAVSIGKTNMDEFAMGSSTENSAYKITKNPWDTTRVPGGSSGGSAAAVAAGEVPVAFGSDTGGSIRQPSAFNGVVGMKPTYGRVSRHGLIAMASSFDQIGPITRNVYDNAVALNAIAGHDEHDATSSSQPVPDFTAHIKDGISGMRISVSKSMFAKGMKPEVINALKKAAGVLTNLGAQIDEVDFPHTKYGVAAYNALETGEASSNLERFDGIRYGYRAKDAKMLEDIYVKSRSQGFGPEVKRRIMLGTLSLSYGYFEKYYEQAAKVRSLIIDDFKNAFKNHDVVFAPTSRTVAFKMGAEEADPIEMYMNDVLTIPGNMAGLPAMSIPAGFSEGLPIGMQLIGKPFDESSIYKVAYAFEQATDFHKRTPKLGGK